MAVAVAGWAEELQILRKQKQEAEVRLTELKNKYRAAKKNLLGKPQESICMGNLQHRANS
jgi:hypothetical protein